MIPVGPSSVVAANRVLAGRPGELLVRKGILALSRVGVRVLSPSDERAISQDLEMSRVMQRVLRADSTVVDVGAHRGLYLRQATRLAPKGHHIAIEPLPELAELLRRRFPTAEVHELAVADWTGVSDFRRVLVAPGYSGFKRRDYDDYQEKVEIIEVKVARLDDIVGDRPVHFMKIDVEGAELEVLVGARELLRRHRPYVACDGMPQEARDELERAGLQISNPIDWLAGRPPHGRSGMSQQIGRWSYLAHPARD